MAVLFFKLSLTRQDCANSKISAMKHNLVTYHMMGAMCLLLLVAHVHPNPVMDMALDENMDDTVGWRSEGVKRADVFMSRGWGAGGMPFNILYTQTPKTGRPSPLRPIATVPQVPLSDAPFVAEPQALRSLRQEQIPYKYSGTRRQYSVIPQLFVSYGWGPIGKK